MTRILLAVLLFQQIYSYGQGQNTNAPTVFWRMNGNNNVGTSDFIGTSNFKDLILKTDNTERLKISKTGDFIFQSVAGIKGILYNDSTGKMTSLPIPNNNRAVLNGKGLFTSIEVISGWSVNNFSVVGSNSGNYGIGVINPKEKLDVNGNINISGKLITTQITSPTKIIKFGDSTAYFDTYWNRITWTQTFLNGGFSIGNNYSMGPNSIAIGHNLRNSNLNSITIGTGHSTTNHLINNIPNSLMIGFNSNNPTMTIYPAPTTGEWGRVGIGVSTANAKLVVQGGSNNHTDNVFVAHNRSDVQLFRITNDGRVAIGQGTPDCQLHINSNPSLNGICVKTNHTQPYGYTILANINHNRTKAFSAFNTNTNKDEFIVYGDGRVYCRELTVMLDNFPDYVFEDKYNLITLSELEKYIKDNKHLPNMPSALEVAKNGINVSELIKLQQEKIEELTLYIIDINNRIKELE